ncbi:MAG: NAD(P)-dependent oxidoreductase [Holosporaceae bacterium]|jgi:nucleoside-diphosphate-sugar epimerase|nr:NAD(P)-dependent oxidoreductase [Holosporaceae bacterium]
MKILLLGGEGFIGRNIADVLNESAGSATSEKYDCYSLGRRSSPFRNTDHHFLKMDPYREKINESFDIIVHLIDSAAPNQELNLLKNIDPRTHVILFSSAVIYANPTSAYGIRKSAVEKIYADHHGKLTILRLFNVYGLYQIPHRQGSLVANIFHNHIHNIPIKINNMDVKRDFIFAEDIGHYLKFIMDQQLYGTYDLATGQMLSIKELCAAIQEVVGSPLNIEDQKKSDIQCPPATATIPCNLNFSPLELGLKKTFDFFLTTRYGAPNFLDQTKW